MYQNYSLIILAGGKGRRLGQEKAWVKFKGQTLLERAVSRLGSLTDQIKIVSAPGQKLPLGGTTGRLEIVEDVYPGKGPLVGIYSGLSACRGIGGFVTACDMPFVNLEFSRYLISLSPGFDVVIPVRGELQEPLHAFYSMQCIKTIGELIEKEDYKIDHLLQRVRTRYVESNDIERFDPAGNSFFNINTLQDLETAVKMASAPSEKQLIKKTEIA